MLIGLLFIIFLFTSSIVKADVYFIPPDIEFEDVNKNIEVKAKNRYNKIEQIENQYKGKLKYKPSNTMIREDRKGRYYTSVGYLINNSIFEEVEDEKNDIKYKIDKKNNFKDTFSAELGLYFRDNISLSIEYFLLSNKSIRFNNVKTKLESQAYFINLNIENNYSKIIPFFGLGAGVIKNDFKEEFIYTYETNEVDGNIIPAYQIFAGLEFMYNDRIILYGKYKYMDFFEDVELERTYINTTSIYKLKLDVKENIIIGFKYLW